MFRLCGRGQIRKCFGLILRHFCDHFGSRLMSCFHLRNESRRSRVEMGIPDFLEFVREKELQAIPCLVWRGFLFPFCVSFVVKNLWLLLTTLRWKRFAPECTGFESQRLQHSLRYGGGVSHKVFPLWSHFLIFDRYPVVADPLKCRILSIGG